MSRVLLIDDDLDTCELISLGLGRRGYECEFVHDAASALDWIRDGEPDAVLCDVDLGEDNGIALCRDIVELKEHLPVVIVTGQGNLETAVEAIRAGAYDFVTKPARIEQLALVLERCVQLHQMRRELQDLRAEVGKRRTSRMIGESRAMKRVAELVSQVASGDSSILVTGESGTGKELVARSIHDASGRDGRFVAINCAAMPATLLESELFGHVKGAFTDAKQDRDGLFVQAIDGTIFLDEIAEMPLEMQAKLLRVLQERSVRPVGGDTEISFNTRIISATNRDLETEVADGRFREDLFYRINVISIDVPPLRSRENDVLLLAQHFIERFATRMDKTVAGISANAALKLRDYNWPGNVRELENCIERAVTLTRYDELTVADLPDAVQNFEPRALVISGDDPEMLPTLEVMETRYITRVLEAVEWNKSRAARVLGVDRRTLYRKIERLKISEPA